MLSGVRAASRGLNLKSDGAIVGQGVRRVPAIQGKPGVGILLYWLTGQPQTAAHMSLKSHWPINLEKCTNHWEACSFVFFYSFDSYNISFLHFEGIGKIYLYSFSVFFTGHTLYVLSGV